MILRTAVFVLAGLVATTGDDLLAAQRQGDHGKPPKEDPPPPEYSADFPALVAVATTSPKESDWQLLLAEADGSNQTTLLNGHTTVDGISLTRIQDPVWSPDGEWIAFGTVSGGLERMGVVSRDGSIVHLIPGVEAEALYDASWSPDGRFIAYEKEVPNSHDDFWVVEIDDLATGAFFPPTRLTYTPAVGEYDPSWAPASDKIGGWSGGGLAIWDFNAGAAGAVPSVYEPPTVLASVLPPGVILDIPMVWAKAHATWFLANGYDENSETRDVWFFDIAETNACSAVKLLNVPAIWDWSGDNRNTGAPEEDETDTEIIFQYTTSNIWKAALVFDEDTGCVIGADTPVPVYAPQRRSKLSGFQQAQWRR